MYSLTTDPFRRDASRLTAPLGAHGQRAKLNAPKVAASDALLDRSHREGLHDSLGWLGLNHHLLPERHPLSSLCRRLQSRLDPEKAWKCELAQRLHLLRGNACEAVDDMLAHTLLHRRLGRDR